MPNKKQIAIEFLKMCAKGDSRKAFHNFVGANFIHHNAYFKGDRQSLMVAMEESAQQMPDKTFEILRTLEDGNLVAVHSRMRPEPSSEEYAVMHIFRFEEDKVMEFWDFGQPVPEDIINENGMF